MINLMCGDDLDARAQARQMIKGHQTFLRNATGNTVNGEVDRFIVNPQGVIADHLHFTNRTAMNGYPNGYGTTEGNTLLLIGNMFNYIVTRDPMYLEQAEATFDVMEKYFFSTPMPTTPQRWVANWTLNAKEPVLANYPYNPIDPTLGGFKGVLLSYTNGRTVVPANAPYWGQYLDKATFAFVGVLSWDSIVGDVVRLNNDGSISYDVPGTKYAVDWVVDLYARKVSHTGAVLEENSTLPIGTIQLQDTSVNGKVKTNFTTKNPVSAGGRYIERNQHWFQYPLWAPSPGANFDTNASDAELWWADAMEMLYSLTGKEKYKLAYECSLATIREYMDIDSTDQFFRKSINASSPFTDGISYYWTYPENYIVKFRRDSQGVTQIPVTGIQDVTFEQQSVWFKINAGSQISIEQGASTSDNSVVSRIIEMELNPNKDAENTTTYIYQLDDTINATVSKEIIPVIYLAKKYDSNGSTFNLANKKALSTYGATTYTGQVEQLVVDSRAAYTIKATLPDSTSGLIIGAWLTASKTFEFNTISYKSSGAVRLRLVDDANWVWEQLLPASASWTTFDRSVSGVYLSNYQPNHSAGDVKPLAPSSAFPQAELVPITSAEFTYYCIDGLPELYNGDSTFTMKVRVIWSGDAPSATYTLGDYTMLNTLQDPLAYTPGVVPFSNNYRPSNNSTFDGYRGLPYAAYQYPAVYVKSGWDNLDERINNVLAFMKDGQDQWVREGGKLGPTKMAYVWNRWDNLQQGTADTWLSAVTGDTVWPGYQPRCFLSAARCWYEMEMNNYPVPSTLIEYTENWAKMIIQFQKDNNGRFPNLFENLTVGCTDVIAGDETGLWLSALAYTYFAGSSVDGLQKALDVGMQEAIDFYTVVAGGDLMNGTWTNNLQGREYYGFWTGEMMRGLSLYILSKDLKPKSDLLTNLRVASI